jgi:acetolactate synthase regulatory subunit
VPATVPAPGGWAAPVAPAAVHRLSVEVDDHPAVLLRVLTVVRRRGYEALAVDYRRGDRHRPARLELQVAGARPERLCSHLGQLLEVRNVETDAPRQPS